jgi:pimeloyl-ACP methyl ester carboxylesterase
VSRRRTWRIAGGVVGGVVGAAATGVAVGTATRWSRLSRERRDPDGDGGTEGSGGRGRRGGPAPAELGAMPPGTPWSVTADDGIRLDAEVIDPAGGRKPDLTAVFVHGFALDRRCWHFQRRVLAARPDSRVRLVFYDHRGHGRSERAPRASCTIEQLGADLDAVLRTLAPDGPLVLIGHSMGGMSVMALAEAHPELFAERVRGVALLCTSAGEVATAGLPGTFLSRRNVLTRAVGALAGWQPTLVERTRSLIGDLIWGVTRAYAYGDRKVAIWLVDFVHTMISANSVDALVDFLDTLNSHDRLAALPGLASADTVILTGEADRIIPPRHSEVIAAELPDATLVELPGVGHMAMLEQPTAVNDTLAELLDRCSPRRGGLSWPRRRA